MKNLKSRRMEYSMRGMKMSSSSNPSQDSAFGSMTDGELSITSSSLRMSSFQSISSPIDEGVEDSVTGLPGPEASDVVDASSAVVECNITSSISETSLAKRKMPKTSPLTSTSTLTLEPPTILVNDRNSVYTTSPSKAGTTEVFSQKYRVSSFEDMTMKKTILKNANRQAFRSLEEERRIDCAFKPVANQPPASFRNVDSSRMLVNNPEKFKKLTHVAFTRKIFNSKERNSFWKNNILTKKNNLMKSNESLHDHCRRGHLRQSLQKRVNSTNELSTVDHYELERTALFSEGWKMNPRKASSERYLLTLTKLKQTAINDFDDGDPDERSVRKELIRTETNSSTESNKTSDETGSSDSSPSHRDICQIIGGMDTDTRSTEEKIPLLEGMELSPISPVESDILL